MKIRIGSYWRNRQNRQHIYKVISLDQKYDLVDISVLDSPFGFTIDRRSFIHDHELLGRLEVLVLFGEEGNGH